MTPTAPHAFADLTHFAALDWAWEHHDVVVVDRVGAVVEKFRFDESGEGWASFRERMRRLGGGIGVAVETRSGWVVEQLLASGVTVYPVNPRTAKEYRMRKAPSGVKNDELDAWSMADALRTDGHGWKPLSPEDPAIQELRLLCRDEIALIQKRTGLVTELTAALREYYHEALEAFEDLTVQASWAFIERFPTPQALAQAGKRRWEKFLGAHRLTHPETYKKRLEVFAKAGKLRVPEGVTRAKSFLAVSLAQQLRQLEQQLSAYRRRIEELFAAHEDAGIFSSLPGAGSKLAPRLLAEFGADRSRFGTPEAIQCHAGTAPVTMQSGKRSRVSIRRACCKQFRATVHQWADHSRELCGWAQAYYESKINKGKSHAAALRCLGQRWLDILWTMWQRRTTYNEALHLQHQRDFGPRPA